MDERLDEQYREALEVFQKTVIKAVEVHAKLRRAPLQGISPTAHLMFARITFMSTSVFRLCPKLKGEPEVWDFSSIAILSRSLFEAIMFFRYFCEPANADEWVARMILLHLHDRCERVRLFTDLGKPEDVAGFEGEAKAHREILQKNQFFQGLEASQQRTLLNGYNAAFLTLRQMGEKFATGDETWVQFQLLSNYAHSYPVGFMRNDEDRRDGLPNDTDKRYIPGVLFWLSSLLEGATGAFLALPSGISPIDE
jgi:hypothetical protein